MALIKCPECGRKISNTTRTCINCGYELSLKDDKPLELAESVNLLNSETRRHTRKKVAIWVTASFGSIILVCIVLFLAFGLGSFLKGVIAYSKGDYSTAVRFLSESEYTLDKNLLPKAKTALYNLAQNKLESEKWDEAIELLTGLEFQDSAVLLESAIKGKGMSENADFAFLASLEESITRRMEITAKEKSEFRTLVTTELAFVEKYSNEEFYDSNLKNLAQKYIDGLHTQLEALDAEWMYEYQINWQKGLVERYEVLSELYEDYGFMEDDKDFIGTYIAQLDEQKALLAAYQAVEADIGKQMDTIEWTYKNQYLSCTIKNNTKYSYSTTFEFTFYDKNNTIIDNTSASIEDISPGNSYVVSVYVAYPSKSASWRWTNYYDDMG